MKKSWAIFTSDMKNLSHNWVAAILIGGLIILPSLYAWLNIYASWDPYSQTNQMKVAIVNEDKGTTVREDQIDVGKDLVTTLKTNQDMDWQFTTRQQAMDKLEYGDYFAVMIIPENFSEQLASVISDKPGKATIDYYVNEKINSIAPKITEKGASVIVNKISNEFIATVNGVIFNMFNELGLELEQKLPDIEKFENYIFDLEKNLPGIHQLLNASLSDANSAKSIISKAQKMLPEAEQMTADGLATVNQTIQFLNDAESHLHKMAPIIKKDIEKVETISKEANNLLKKLQSMDLDFTELKAVKNHLHTDISTAIEKLDEIESSLAELKSLKAVENASPANTGMDTELRDKKLDQAIEATNVIKSILIEAQQNAVTVDEIIKGKEDEMSDAIQTLHQIAENTSVQLDAFVKEYQLTIEPTILKEVANAKKTLYQAQKMMKEIQSTLPDVKRVLSTTSLKIDEGKSVIHHALKEYPFINDKVNQLAANIRRIEGKTDINEIIQLLRNDPQAERSFFEEPIVLNENKLFPIENYGTGMTPFYTVLSIWVGCLLLISLLSVDVINNDHLLHVRPIYFGKLFTFWAIGLLQTTIATIGDIALLGVNVASPVLFILFGLFISLVFMAIVYTLVSIFGNVGKALAIILLVLQIAGSGGTYPVALLPPFFQWINPALPFTHAVNLMREAVGGIVWKRVHTDMLFLTVCGVIVLLLGTFLKGFVNQKTQQFLKKSKESNLFH